MKKILLILIISGLGLQNTFAQEQKYDWKTMKPDERKAIIQKMSPQERMSLLKQFRQNMVVSELDIPENKQEQYKTLYS